MKKFVYPAVVYYDEDNKLYLMYIDELDISGTGTSVEECNEKISDTLDHYMTTALQFNLEIPQPQDYDMVVKQFPKNSVMLITASIDESKIKSLS